VDQARGPKVDLAAVAARLRVPAGVLGVAAVGAAVVEGLVAGLTFAVLARWALVFVVLLAAAVAAVLLVDAARRRRGG
jgi:hypothetical protein